MSDIDKELCWVTLKYNDSSYRHILTTLNNNILGNIEVPPGFLYDFRNKRLVNLSEVEDATVSENLVGMGNELSQYLYNII